MHKYNFYYIFIIIEVYYQTNFNIKTFNARDLIYFTFFVSTKFLTDVFKKKAAGSNHKVRGMSGGHPKSLNI